MAEEPHRHRGTRSRAGGFAAGFGRAGALAAPWRLHGVAPAFLHWLRAQVERERDSRRPFLWLPVGLAAGILLYFAADREPWIGAPLVAAALCAALAFAARERRSAAFACCVGACAVFCGFAAANLRTLLVAAPVLDRIRVARVTGYVESVDPRIGGARLVLRPSSIEGVVREALPERVRVSTSTRLTIAAGDFVTATARLAPPAEPSRPGGYDFAREAFFQRLGAVGSVSGAVALAPAPGPAPLGLRLAAAVDRARNDVTSRIAGVIGGPSGAVAAALVTGKRGYIDEATNDALRGAGIYHVVSISGLHMILAAGMVFWLVRALLACVPNLSQNWPIKKWAALAAMVAGVGYNVFAGSEIATQRSLAMTLALLGAILADRPALSMRNLALAAVFVLLAEPETLLGPSFQMSFAAVAALIAIYEKPGGAGVDPEAGAFAPFGGSAAQAVAGPPPGPAERLVRHAWTWVSGAVLTTLVAEAATAPFSIYHFQRFNPYGVIGNALTLPLVSVIVMPAALVGAIAIPFGLDGPVWRVMGIGVGWMIDLSRMVADWRGSTQYVHAIDIASLLVLSVATLWATLWRSALRALAVPLAALGLVVGLRAERADLVVAPDGRSLAARAADGRLAVVGRTSGSFGVEQWLRADGDARAASDPSLFRVARCDPTGCVLRLSDGRALSHVLQPAAFEEDCRRADVLVTPLLAPAWCKPPLLVDRRTLATAGAVTYSFAAEQRLLQAARGQDVTRPWTTRRALPPPPPASAPAPAPTRADAVEPDAGAPDD
ncbi:ComEC family competence protein [Alsobacter sp. SYSU M60028]|uniref:ComEC family competence protein n=1 Tax=Alsobacter ponti TaxID=2962936 RepID=A0ABT1L9N9_9HYPH|nr:ComEC/Rec2 family competence protein [Alsobacter ponti]MCP8938202.1 ComEC family competence protein [Alsobacter ponti]